MSGSLNILTSPPMEPYGVLGSRSGANVQRTFLTAVSAPGVLASARIELFDDGTIHTTLAGTVQTKFGTDHWLNVTRPAGGPPFWVKLHQDSGSPTDLTGAPKDTWLQVQQGVSYWESISTTGNHEVYYSLQFCADNGSGAPTTVVLATFALWNIKVEHRVLVPPVWVDDAAPDGEVGVAYSYQFVATGATTYTLGAGNIPPGLTLSVAGLLSGTPTTEAPYSFIVNANSADGTTPSSVQEVDITTPLAAPTWIAQNAPDGEVTVPYSYQFVAVEAVTAYTLGSGALPPGLTLASDGLLSGTPTTVGVLAPGTRAYGFTVDATNAAGTTASTLQAVTVTFPVPTWVDYSPPPGSTLDPYEYTFLATPGPCTYAVETGAVPPGLTLHTATGVLDGTPSSTGSFAFTLRATNAGGFTLSPSMTIAVTNVLPAPVFTAQSAPNGTAGVAYSYQYAAGPAVTAYALGGGALPDGLTLSTSGLLSGTPTLDGAFNFSVTAQNASAITTSNNQPVTIAISAPVFTAQAAPGGTAGQAYSYQYVAGPAVSSYSLASGTLPAGLTLSSSGLLSGTPITSGTYAFVVRATNSTGSTNSTSQSVVIAISYPVFTNQSAPNGTVGTAYSYTFTAGPSVTNYAVSSGALPAGLSLSTAGVLSGTPTTSATSTFTVRATNSSGYTDSVSQVVAVSAVPLFVLTRVNAAWLWSADGVTWTACTGTMPYKCDVLLSGNGVFIAMGRNSSSVQTNDVYRSTDGKAWSTSTTLSTRSDGWGAGCWDGTYFYIANTISGQMYRSTDGTSWYLNVPTNTDGIATMFVIGGKPVLIPKDVAGNISTMYVSSDYCDTFSVMYMPAIANAATSGYPVATVGGTKAALFSPADPSYNYTTDSGANWTAVYRAFSASGTCRAAAMKPDQSQIVGMVQDSFNFPSKYGTVNSIADGAKFDSSANSSMRVQNGAAYGAGCYIVPSGTSSGNSKVGRSTSGSSWSLSNPGGAGYWYERVTFG